MSGYPRPLKYPTTNRTNIATRAVFIILGIVALALGIYYGLPRLTAGKVTTPASGGGSGTPTPPQPGPTPGPGGSGTGPTPVCSPLTLDILSSDTKFQGWYSANNTDLQAKALITTPTQTDLNTLNANAAEIANVGKCLNEKYGGVQNPATLLAQLQADLANLDTTIEQRKHDVQVARDRAALQANPELNRSYYDGWFPLERPLKHYTIPILIGFALFFISVAFLNILALLGVDVRIFIKTFMGTGAGAGYSLGRPFWIMSGIAGILLGLTIYGFTKG